MAPILIAEDDLDAAAFSTEGLKPFHCSVLGAVERGKDLSSAIEKHLPDLVLANIFLAGSWAI